MRRQWGRRTALAAALSLVMLSVAVTAVSSQRLPESAGATSTIVSRDGVELVVTRTEKHDRPVPVPVGSSKADAPTDSRVRSDAATAGANSTIGDDARFDLDGDGLDEIVSQVTANSPDIGYRRVVIDYSHLPVRDFVGSSVTPQAHGFFGAAMATGDFDGDGNTDLVIGDAGEFVSGQPGGEHDVAGAVWVFRGTRRGNRSGYAAAPESGHPWRAGRDGGIRAVREQRRGG